MSVIKIESEYIKAGIVSGLIAGAVFRVMLGMMGMPSIITKLLGRSLGRA